MAIERLTDNSKPASQELKERRSYDRVLGHLLDRLEALEHRVSGLDGEHEKSDKEHGDDLDKKHGVDDE